MAHPDGTSARAHRVIGLAASLLLAVTTALAFGRVFLGATTGFKLIAVAIASAVLAVVFERRSLLLATIASAAGVAVAVGLIVFPDTTWYGLPTADTLRAALDAAGAVGEQARIQVAPAIPIAPLLLAAVVSLWAAVFSAHALAFRAGSPLLGLIPPVALVAFADTVLEQFVKPLYGWAFLVAALLVVFSDGLARVQGWGPVWSSSRRGVASTAGRGARRIAGTALVAALVAPILVPGFGSRAVIDFGASSDERISIDPFVSVTNQLGRSTPVTVLEFTSPEPTYLRLVSLPIFDGRGWRPDPPDRIGQPLGDGGTVPTLSSLGTDAESVKAELVEVRVVTGLQIPWVPTPHPVRSIQLGGSSVTYDAETGTAFAEPPLQEGDTYTLSASFATPSADDLRAIPDSPGFGAPGGDDRYLALPPDLPAGIRDIARAWTEGESSVFDRAMAIQERLRTFDYDENTKIGGGTEAIVTFLRETRAGFCQQFAASMAVMLRTLDIPARVVVGFGSGPLVRGTYQVSSERAHAWVEVNFEGFGWMPFEPTPRRLNPAVQAYTAASEGCTGPGCGDEGEGAGSGANVESGRGASQGDLRPGPQFSEARGREGGAGSVAGLAPETSRVSARLALLLAAIAAGVGFLLMPVVRAIRRRLALGRTAGEPRRSILVTYEQFTERAAGMGLARARGETFDEYLRKVLETGYLSDGQLDRLTRIATAAAYSQRDPDQADARSASEAAGTALTEIRRAVGRARWLVGLYRR